MLILDLPILLYLQGSYGYFFHNFANFSENSCQPMHSWRHSCLHRTAKNWTKIMARSLCARILGVKFPQGFDCKSDFFFTTSIILKIVFITNHLWTWYRSIHKVKLSIKGITQTLTLIQHFLTIRNWVKQGSMTFWKLQESLTVMSVVLPQMFVLVITIRFIATYCTLQ